MDASRFDDLARLLGSAAGRRPVLRALLGAALGTALADATDTAARKRKRGKDRDRDRDADRDKRQGRGQPREQGQDRLQAEGRGKKRRRKKKRGRRGANGGQTPEPLPADCCGTKPCDDPEPGSTSAGCDFAGRSFAGQDLNGSLFRGIDGRAANFNQTDNRGSVFAEACLQGASFRNAELDGSTWRDACLFDADFTGADLGGDLTLFDNALFCNTVMPDGSVNDRDCDRETPCCRRDAQPGPTCQTAGDCPDHECQTKSCQNGQCAYTPVVDGSDPTGQCRTHCCESGCCNPGATSCNALGLCCVPNCAGRNCGDDGCGGSCGACPAGGVCDDISGVCLCTRQSCPNGCCTNGPGNPGICQPGTTNQSCGSGGGACRQCTAQEQCEDGVCEPAVCIGSCTQDSDCPDLRNCVCNRAEGTCCARNCTGKVCGSDGCGGTCENLCPPNTVCGPDGTTCLCTAESCPNGCCSNGLGNPGTCEEGDTNEHCGRLGESCQTCTGQEQCQNNQCVCIPLTCGDRAFDCGTLSDGCGHTLECGTCQEPGFPSCFVGVCVPCSVACPGCPFCVNLTNGNTVCGGGNAEFLCTLPSCSTNASCTDPDFPVCIASTTDRPTNQTTTALNLCPGVGATAICGDPGNC
jgi:hypothetical protein